MTLWRKCSRHPIKKLKGSERACALYTVQPWFPREWLVETALQTNKSTSQNRPGHTKRDKHNNNATDSCTTTNNEEAQFEDMQHRCRNLETQDYTTAHSNNIYCNCKMPTPKPKNNERLATPGNCNQSCAQHKPETTENCNAETGTRSRTISTCTEIEAKS